MACRYWHLCVDVWGHIQDIPESDHLDDPTGSDICSHLLHGIQPVHSSLCPFTFCHSLHFNLEDDDNGYRGAWLWCYFPSVYRWFNVQCSRHPLSCHLLHNVGHLSHSYASPLHKLIGEFETWLYVCNRESLDVYKVNFTLIYKPNLTPVCIAWG